ncbi:MAG: hypothetical protein DCF19_04865 [Pseudanabaena frigida]|uniref:Uncharacterized protein n=1 Tax=Pseudanabaena frigida TaxID=945775 RepID=A0A2W4Y8H6_9CYAN|nr:MAG: hypothetical protein DCF19_04865 [Pseudanabaena frigida]
MITTNFVVLTLSMAALSMLSATELAASDSCPIAKSIYRDGDGKGFQLIFSPPSSGGVFLATATIDHNKQGQLYRFQVTQSNGYGSVWLLDRETKYSKRDRGLWIAFFDQNLKSATPLFLEKETESPKYAVIAELGSYDYYKRRDRVMGNSSMLLSDTIWIFDRCQ